MRALILLMLMVALPVKAAEFTLVAVASNFAEPLDEIAERYGQRSGHRIAISSGSSGKFYTQIVNRAPFDAFFSADQHKPEELEKAGLIVPGSRFTYATGTLVLWSAFDDQPVIPEVLAGDSYQRLSIANPKLAPYGIAARQTLEHLGLVDVTNSRLVRGENVAQAFAFVETRNAELGFVALSQVWLNGQFLRGNGWKVPAAYHEPIVQDAVLLKRGANNDAAKGLLAFMRSPEAVQVMRAYGYRIAEK